MLTCKDIAKQASDYVDGQMTVRQRLAFAFHLLVCGQCREFLRQLRLAVSFYQRMPAKELSAQEADAIVARIVRSNEPE
jgi:hypothetical protein